MVKIDYDRVSQVYDSVRVGDPLVIKKILELTTLDSNSRILELGCGTGNNLMLLSHVTEAKLYGMDQSQGMLDKAKAKTTDINLFIEDALSMKTIEDDFFDAIFMVDVIHHITDLELMFKNIHRVLKKNGMVLIFSDSHENIKHNRLVSKYFPETVEKELERYPSEIMIKDAMSKNQFEGINAEDLLYQLDDGAGERLIKIAETKGYSMFHLITDKAIQEGIARLKVAIAEKSIAYIPKSQILYGQKL